MTVLGFLSNFKAESISKSEKTGNLTLVDLKPEECLLLLDKMNRQTFLGRQIFVTSVVAGSPVKIIIPAVSEPAAEQAAAQSGSNLSDSGIPPASSVNLNLGSKLKIRSSSVSSQLDSVSTEYVWGPVSPSVQEKIDTLQQQSSKSKFSNMTPLEKRKSDGSPEAAALSRRDKKIMKSAEKKQRKQDHKAVRTLNVQSSQ